eukprot:TRINITY_DN10886_c0_g1_i26.p1 TRINITY_DN10886_c0_g1~~TRINITY_DN10886_c0_g1_i26.p1  ORF type:complete len:644 (+),score=85.02 TRINITY_DN10886_c0_g1_i26:332-2263(+)
MSVSELTNSINARYKELFPGKLVGRIEGLQDEKFFDLDPSLTLREVLKTGDIVEANVVADKPRPPAGGNAHLTSGVRPLDLDLTDTAMIEYRYSGGPIPPFPGFYVGFDLLQSALDGFVNSMMRQRCNEANPALVVIGGSKSGKSTLLRSILPSYALRQGQLKMTKFLILDGTGVTQASAEGILREFLYLLRNAVKDCFRGDILPHTAEAAHGTSTEKADARELIRDVCRRLDAQEHETVILIDDLQRLFEADSIADAQVLTKFFFSLMNAPSTRGHLRFAVSIHALHVLGFVLDPATYHDAADFFRSSCIKAMIPLQATDVYLKLSGACLSQKFKLARSIAVPFFDSRATGTPARQATLVDRYKLIRLTHPQDNVAVCASQALGHVSDDLIAATRRELATFLARNARAGRLEASRKFITDLQTLAQGVPPAAISQFTCHRFLKDTLLGVDPNTRVMTLQDSSLTHLLQWLTPELAPEPTPQSLYPDTFYSLELACILHVISTCAERIPAWDQEQRGHFEVLSLQHFCQGSAQTSDLSKEELKAQLEIDMRQSTDTASPYDPVRYMIHYIFGLPECREYAQERQAYVLAHRHALSLSLSLSLSSFLFIPPQGRLQGMFAEVVCHRSICAGSCYPVPSFPRTHA